MCQCPKWGESAPFDAAILSPCAVYRLTQCFQHGSKGHQLKNGKVFAVGDYVSQFSFDEYWSVFEWDVYSRLDLLLRDLRSRVGDGAGYNEAHEAAELHKDTVMAHFYRHVTEGNHAAFFSHTVCYSCLFEPPEHPLPCGHILCTSCLQAYGKKRGRNVFEIHECPLESELRSRNQPWKIVLKPPSAGVRILTLDGSVLARDLSNFSHTS